MARGAEEKTRMALDKDTFDQVLASIDRFVDERLIPAEAQVEAEDDIPPDIAAEMREMGLFGFTIP